MIELFSTFSLEHIILVLFMSAIALKEVIEIFNYFKNLIKNKTKEETDQEDNLQKIVNDIEEIKTDLEQIKESHVKHNKQLETLLGSDREDIRAFIVNKHHIYVNKEGWIDDYTMDVIEKRYAYYKEEGGNSYVHQLMKEIRALPKRPPKMSLKE